MKIAKQELYTTINEFRKYGARGDYDRLIRLLNKEYNDDMQLPLYRIFDFAGLNLTLDILAKIAPVIFGRIIKILASISLHLFYSEFYDPSDRSPIEYLNQILELADNSVENALGAWFNAWANADIIINDAALTAAGLVYQELRLTLKIDHNKAKLAFENVYSEITTMWAITKLSERIRCEQALIFALKPWNLILEDGYRINNGLQCPKCGEKKLKVVKVVIGGQSKCHNFHICLSCDHISNHEYWSTDEEVIDV